MRCVRAGLVAVTVFLGFSAFPRSAPGAPAAPSPSPVPSASRLQTAFYARSYEAALRTSGLETGSNSFAIFQADYAIGARDIHAGGAYFLSNADALAPQGSVSKILESYVAYDRDRLTVTAGNQFFASPWADTHFKLGLVPTAYQGVDARYGAGGWTFEGARMDRFESRSATSFSQLTLITNAAGAAIGTPGFSYGRIAYASQNGAYALDAYAYGMSDLLNMLWFSGKVSLSSRGWQPFVAAQGGIETNAGASYLGKIRSSASGVLAGVQPVPEIALSVAVDAVPWRRDALALPSGVSCDDAGRNPTYQIRGSNRSFAYFLPQGVAQCARGFGRGTDVYYGGWASPYSEGYATDPLYTTELLEGLPDRQSPGHSAAGEIDYFSPDKRLEVSQIYVRFNYGNAAATQATSEWDSTMLYRFGTVSRSAYKGLLMRAGYIKQYKTNVAYANGAPYLGGTPSLRYGRMQVEYFL